MEQSGGQQRNQARAVTWPPSTTAGALAPHHSWTWPFDWLRAWAQAEAGPGRLLPWVPVAFGAGIALYFAAEREPVAGVAAATACAFAIAAILLRRSSAFPTMLLAAALAAGFACATWKSARIAHEVLAKPVFGAALTGFVETREERERSDRFVLRVATMETPRDAIKLTRVRLSVKKGTAPAVGSFVTLKARLQPPLAPLRPGGYDFARDLYFQGIGASGFVTGAIRKVDPPTPPSRHLQYAATMQGMRDAIDARIRASLTGDNRAIATALLTGRRDAISSDVNDAMFISGLGHVLSISGYHMAVVAGVVFFVVRALLALIPVLTVTFPIKKVAAAAALLAALFYLLLSGAEVATQRSFIMTAVVLIAVMVDRRAITFRTLAIAALIVLIVTPEALVHPSFQMSFAATLGLVALVQIGMPALFATSESSTTARIALWGGRELSLLLLASLVAGLATMPYAAYHFHRITPYGIIANLLAMPVVSILVMPAGLLGLIAIPFGFDSLFWHIMEIGLQWMIFVSKWVAGLPGAIGRVSAFGTGPLIAASFGIILLALLRTPLRYAGVIALAVATVWAAFTRQPDVLIAGDGQSVAVRGRDGRLHVMRSGKDAFLVKEWLGADADARLPTDASLGEGVSCDPSGCVTALGDGALIALTLMPDAFSDDCERTVLIVTAKQAPTNCRAMVIDRERLQGQGATSLRRVGDGFSAETTRTGGLQRPWARGPVDAVEAASSTGQRTRQGPVDATPAETDLAPDD
ncbi:ComEC family competence protein [Tardiphaga alba]|uniref:ComEC family competence protein n=1 Tax=Tardiphaga alba TaxID=340268 RepID=A0ABX8A8X5_9BRAD|nr:ComEC/Rec2 family competence protein [Tardiphaga alba]QUS40184.1 ComEC family competence protein [Tardiphaga alba]